METKNIGIEVKEPVEKCDDRNCPFHGTLKVRGKIFTGTVKSAKMHKTATIEWTRQHYIPKYERFEKRQTRIKAHNPLCIKAKENDVVRIGECRPLSKTKRFVIIEKVSE
jgi:small subunit ribosomal protein S17